MAKIKKVAKPGDAKKSGKGMEQHPRFQKKPGQFADASKKAGPYKK